MDKQDMSPSYHDENGMGDIIQSFFFSPRNDEELVWGVGPAFSLPTATEDDMGSGKYTVGPTGVALIQHGKWTSGVLANTLWPVGGEDRDDESYATSYIQPFFNRAFGNGFSTTFSSETSYDWTSHEKLVPVYVMFNQLLPVNGHLFNVSIGPGYNFETPDDYNSDWIFRFQFTLLFPKA